MIGERTTVRLSLTSSICRGSVVNEIVDIDFDLRDRADEAIRQWLRDRREELLGMNTSASLLRLSLVT